MTEIFSIKSSIPKIQNANTRKYFKEVYEAFENNNFRASIIMLYSVFICDLVYKLRDLRDIYHDSNSKKMLDIIEDMQLKDSASTEWERNLIELIKEKFLLEPADIVAIETLQKLRNLSAHPNLNTPNLLYEPDKETVQSLIRNVLESALTCSPLFSNKISAIMLNDLEEVKGIINDDVNLERYLKSRYLSRLRELDFRKLFRSMWELVLMTDDKKSTDNIELFFKILNIFISNNKRTCLDLIKNETNFYSNINREARGTYLIRLLAIYPDFYSYLDNSLKDFIEIRRASDDEYKFLCSFFAEGLRDHFLSFKPYEFDSIPLSAYIFMKNLCLQKNCLEELVEFTINHFGESSSFAETTARNYLISEISNELSSSQLKKLLEVSNANSQIYFRHGMKRDLRDIAAKKWAAQIDITKYDKLRF